jgi:hypothetical protein
VSLKVASAAAPFGVIGNVPAPPSSWPSAGPGKVNQVPAKLFALNDGAPGLCGAGTVFVMTRRVEQQSAGPLERLQERDVAPGIPAPVREHLNAIAGGDRRRRPAVALQRGWR